MQHTSLPFVFTTPSLRGWRLAILVASVVVLIVSAVRWASQKESIYAVQAKLAQTQPQVVLQPARSAAEERRLDAQLKAIAAAIRQLNMPIGELIKVLQPPKDIRVVLLNLDVSGKGDSGSNEGIGASGVLKIGAEAKTPQEMMTYVAFLAEQRLFKSVYLIKHEISTASREKPYRFQLEAQWRE